MNLMKLKLIKKETILSLALIVGFLILVGLNSNVLASNTVQFNTLNLTTTNGTNNADSIEIVNTQNTANTLNTVNNTTNTPGQLADTGLEDLPYLVITLLVISAIFAYKKIEEYKSF